MFCVETNSFLPNEQSGGRDLTRQGEARQMWLHASGDAGLVKVLERSHGRGGSRRCTLEDIFQIVSMVDVEPAYRQELLGAFQLPTDESIFPTGVGPQRRATGWPEVSPGAAAS